jgi:hypothetical protein
MPEAARWLVDPNGCAGFSVQFVQRRKVVLLAQAVLRAANGPALIRANPRSHNRDLGTRIVN